MSRCVQLRRYNTSQPWGFKMQGGTDVGMPLFVAHVSPNSIASQAGLKAGDAILKIGDVDVVGCTHEQARGEMIRCGNDIDLAVQSGLINPPQTQGAVEEDRPRMSVSDSDSPYQEVTSKTFKMLENELPEAEASGLGGVWRCLKDDKNCLQCCYERSFGSARPASIFDKKRQERSAYTKADKSGYTKPFGQAK